MNLRARNSLVTPAELWRKTSKHVFDHGVKPTAELLGLELVTLKTYLSRKTTPPPRLLAFFKLRRVIYYEQIPPEKVND